MVSYWNSRFEIVFALYLRSARVLLGTLFVTNVLNFGAKGIEKTDCVKYNLIGLEQIQSCILYLAKNWFYDINHPN